MIIYSMIGFIYSMIGFIYSMIGFIYCAAIEGIAGGHGDQRS